jgi:hypothetical protein
MRLFKIISLAAASAYPAYGVAVDVPVDDLTANLGLLLQAGYRHEFVDIANKTEDESDFVVPEAELRTYGRIFDKVEYDVRATFYYTRYIREASIGTALPGNLSAKVGRFFIPFGVEATTYEGYLTCSSRTATSYIIAPGRNTGVRFDYLRERDGWPYKIGAAAGVFNGAGPLVDAGGRIYGTPLPAVKDLELGVSYFYAKTPREKFRLYRNDEEHYLEEPRVGADLTFKTWRLELSAEYMQRFYNDYPMPGYRYREPYYFYKDTYARGYFGTLKYTQPLPWRYFQDIAPYARYERWDPAVLERGDIAEKRFTGGLALHFLGRNLMFRADYTRILEDECPTTNDEIASQFQVMF